MSTFLVIGLLILLVGPLRRPFLRHARFTVPAFLVNGIGAGIAGTLAQIAGLPLLLASLVAIVVGLSLGLTAGEAYKKWCDRIFGPAEPPDDRPRA